MKSLLSRLTIMYIIMGAIIGGLGHKAITHYQEQAETDTQLSLSYDVGKQIYRLRKAKTRKRASRELKKLRPLLKPESRKKAVSDVISAANNASYGRLLRTIRHFNKVDAEFKRVAYKNLKIYRENVEYFASLCISAIVGFYFFLYLYLKTKLFSPIRSISKKMKDFLVDKYTYQFSVPPDNEIGELQTSFNSMAQKVLTQVDELQALDNAKSEFLSIASHELRTPMTSIKGSLGLLQSGVTQELNEASMNLVNIAETETDRLIRLINDILDLSKIEARMLPFEKSWVDLKQVITQTIASLEGLASTAKVKIVGVELIEVYGFVDEDRIQQVLTNLISNAVKYSPENGNVYVGFSSHDMGHLKIYVKDEGTGIAPEDQSLIFDKFRQATGKDNPLVKGTGLGLAISKAFVEEHDGIIDVVSKPGEGAEFFFTLPHWQREKPNYPTKDQAA